MLLPSLLKTKSHSSDHLVLLVLPGLQFDRFGTVASGELGSLHRCQRDFLSRCYPRACPVDFRYRRARQLPGRPV